MTEWPLAVAVTVGSGPGVKSTSTMIVWESGSTRSAHSGGTGTGSTPVVHSIPFSSPSATMPQRTFMRYGNGNPVSMTPPSSTGRGCCASSIKAWSGPIWSAVAIAPGVDRSASTSVRSSGTPTGGWLGPSWMANGPAGRRVRAIATT